VPAVSSTIATLTGTETFTNKTLTAPTLTSPNITTALTLTSAAGTSGQVLTSAGSGSAPTWTTVSASQWTTSGSNIYYNTGKVGIGTSSPSSALHISGSALSDGSDIKLQNTASGGGTWRIGDGVGGNAGSLSFYDSVAGATAFSINSSQNVTFTKNVTTNGGKFAIQSGGTEYGAISTASGDVTYASSNGGYLKLSSNSSQIIGYTTSGQAFNASGTNFNIVGALSKGSGSFRIEHPLPSLSETHQLVHSFIEGPQADLIYRGKVNLVNGQAQINIDSVATMTDGTFEVLCRDIQCFTSNESDWGHVRGSVTGNILNIEAQDNTSSALVSWMVIGERKDKHMMHTEWTDENGKVIVEPLKVIDERASL
jgi:hypothetical protein